MDITSNLKSLIFKLCFLFLSCTIILWFSVFSYGLLYYLYIPAVAHVKPVYLQYDMKCFKEKFCRYPYDNITLFEGGRELLSHGQAYAVELVLEMPDSETNLSQGMFMIQLNMLSENGDVVKSSRRPALLHYRSPLFKIIYTLFYIPGLLAGSVEEKQSMIVPLFEKYVVDPHHPPHYAYVVIEAQTVEVYSCSLRIHAQFTGLRYMMYYWPVLSAIVGVVSNFFCIIIIVAFVWVRQIMNVEQVVSKKRNLNVQKQTKPIKSMQTAIKGEQPLKPEGILRRKKAAEGKHAAGSIKDSTEDPPAFKKGVSQIKFMRDRRIEDIQDDKFDLQAYKSKKFSTGEKFRDMTKKRSYLGEPSKRITEVIGSNCSASDISSDEEMLSDVKEEKQHIEEIKLDASSE